MEVKRLEEPDPMTGCVLDHNTIESKQVTGEAGTRWAHCPFCNVMVEANKSTLAADTAGQAWHRARGGRGTGELTSRQMDRLKAWFGWVQFNGGDEEVTLKT